MKKWAEIKENTERTKREWDGFWNMANLNSIGRHYEVINKGY